MLTLFDYLPSQNAWKVRTLLRHLQTPYTQKFISIFEGEGQLPAHLRINPTGAVPAIMLENGQCIAESNAILVYLAQATPYYPTDPIKKAQVLQWLFFEADYVQANVATLRHWVMTGKDKNRSENLLTMKRNASEKVLATLDSSLDNNKFLCGKTYTIADISVFAYVHLAEDAGLKLKPYSNLRKWIDAVHELLDFSAEVYPYSIDKFSHREL